MKRLGQLGQTSVEYMLMIAVAVSICVLFKNKFSDYFVRSPNSFINRSLNLYKSQLAGKKNVNGIERPYKTFPVVIPGRRFR